jgi:hypothetical protein
LSASESLERDRENAGFINTADRKSKKPLQIKDSQGFLCFGGVDGTPSANSQIALQAA